LHKLASINGVARRKTDIVVNLHALCLQPASASLEMSKSRLN